MIYDSLHTFYQQYLFKYFGKLSKLGVIEKLLLNGMALYISFSKNKEMNFFNYFYLKGLRSALLDK